MAGLEVVKQYFPLCNINGVLSLFRQQFKECVEPDLALLSIIVGAIENSLTCNRTVTAIVDPGTCVDNLSFPPLEFHIVDALYTKFHAVIKGSVDPTLYGNTVCATRDLVKRVSDVIWNTLTRSYYKDRAHLQSLYSYLTGNKLDCFGVAFAVVAGCQALGYSDVHLALSEDHAWVVFGESGQHSAEVTWHGKGNEDRRGQPVAGGILSRSWLYLNGHPVICSRAMEVAALVSAVNPSLSANRDAAEVATLQQELLWLLYGLGHLDKYPMALGNLGDLEEVCPTPGHLLCTALFEQAIQSSITYYENHHVYPYTYLGGYYYRIHAYKESLASWADAANVIRQYNYTRDDEEIYKEFLEIANELIPLVIKVASSGHSARSLLKDPECFAHLLRFYDGICEWEEGSSTPVLHIGWAKPLVNTISKFDAEVRAQVIIVDDENVDRAPKENGIEHEKENKKNDIRENGEEVKLEDMKKEELEDESILGSVTGEFNNNLNNNNYKDMWPNSDAFIRSLETAVGEERGGEPHPSIAALTEACSEGILNPGFLLGKGDPFAQEGDLFNRSPSSTSQEGKNNEQSEKEVNGLPKAPDSTESPETNGRAVGDDPELDKVFTRRPRLVLHSQKMKGLQALLLAEKLNTHAISLQLTAQSQVGRKTEASGGGVGARVKRARRD